jgi:hypothetical protein
MQAIETEWQTQKRSKTKRKTDMHKYIIRPNITMVLSKQTGIHTFMPFYASNIYTHITMRDMHACIQCVESVVKRKQRWHTLFDNV